jgi:hypothetical protein
MSDQKQPQLLQAKDFDGNDIGQLAWDEEKNSDYLRISNDGLTVEWDSDAVSKDKYDPSWIPSSTRLQLHSGRFTWDFAIENMGEGQIGVGFLLIWDQGVDWGFYGYLGAGQAAWSYDPSTGDVVNATESIQGGLPFFENKESGVVSMDMVLPREGEGYATFSVNGVTSDRIALPAGSLVLPAACFLKKGQKITLRNFKRL